MNTQIQTDNELIRQFIDGRQSSIEELIHRYKNQVYTYINLLVKNQALAEDILQDSFIKVIKSLKTGKYQENGKFLSWVLRISHNLVIDHYRKAKQINTISNDRYDTDLFNSTKFSDDTIEDKMIDNQITDEVKALIEQLPDDQKQVIYLRHYADLSFKEIAEQTNVSINTALGRMRYALINLRKMIEDRKLSLTRI